MPALIDSNIILDVVTDDPKTSTLPDFLIGGHAEALGFRILTRDTARYQTYFPKVELIYPEA